MEIIKLCRECECQLEDLYATYCSDCRPVSNSDDRINDDSNSDICVMPVVKRQGFQEEAKATTKQILVDFSQLELRVLAEMLKKGEVTEDDVKNGRSNRFYKGTSTRRFQALYGSPTGRLKPDAGTCRKSFKN